MRLDELNELARSASYNEMRAADCKRAACEIAAERKGDLPLPEATQRLRQYGSANGLKVAALQRAEALLRDDLFRVAEMDLEAQARGYLASAKAKLAQVALYCGEGEPVVPPATGVPS